MADRTQTTKARRMGNPTFAAYQARIDAGGGLTAREWDHWADIFKQLDPADYAAYRERVHHDLTIDRARTLSVTDLRTLVAEKELSDGR